MKTKFLQTICALFFSGVLAVVSQAQTTNAPQVDLNALLDKAEQSTINYRESFKNLTANESKTIEKYGKNGEVKDTRRIKSTFIVYQSDKDDSVSEFRSVSEFNGKSVGRNDAEVAKFFEKLAKSDSPVKEYDRVQKESARYDGDFIVTGATLNQGFELAKAVRSAFDFKIVDTKNLDGRSVVTVEYRQREATERIAINPDDSSPFERTEFNVPLPKDVDERTARVNGKVDLDAETGQIRADEYAVSIENQNQPLVIVNNKLEYQPSKYDILTPKKFVLTTYQVIGKNKNFTAAKLYQATLEYSAFQRVGTSVDDYKIKSKQ